MSQSKTIMQKTDASRLLKDKLAQYGVKAGGILVLCALLLLFFYLLYIVAPVFTAATINEKWRFNLTDKNYQVLQLDEQNEFLYGIADAGDVDFYSIAKQSLIKSETIDIKGQARLFGRSSQQQHLFGFINQEAELTIVKPFFKIEFNLGKRQQTPFVTYPYGKQPIQLSHHDITQFSFNQEDDTLAVLYKTRSGGVYLSKHHTRPAVEVSQQIESQVIELKQITEPVQHLFLSPDLSRAFVLSQDIGYVFNIRKFDKVSLLYQFAIGAPEGSHLTSANLHAGANSLLLGFSNGYITQWFETIANVGRDFIQVREFYLDSESTASAITHLSSEPYRRSFLAVNQLGQAALFHTTSKSQLWQGELTSPRLTNLSFSPRAREIIYRVDGQVVIAEVDNEHPEVTWSALWQQIWYEGYPEPSYTWQSSSASDDFEPKFSLVPITFGTIKAALYAMLFAVPIGLAAAIYTAYFMAPKARQIVKPTVEIMEALPTVILGFLAGLWLAPLIEQRLPGFVLGLVLLPIAILATAAIWLKLPERLKGKVPDGWEAMLLLPIIALVALLSYLLSPSLELWLFNGDTRQFITHDLGISFDQRNSLVVGIAMGFAVIPTVFSIAEDAVFSVPKTLSNGSLALGATKWQTLIKVVLLTASPGIFSAVMMGLGRAVGETMIVLMATGNTPIMDWSVFQGMRTLSANIAVEMPESEVGSSHYRILFLAAFVLFIFTFVFNTIAEFVRQRLREKYSSL